MRVAETHKELQIQDVAKLFSGAGKEKNLRAEFAQLLDKIAVRVDELKSLRDQIFEQVELSRPVKRAAEKAIERPENVEKAVKKEVLERQLPAGSLGVKTKEEKQSKQNTDSLEAQKNSEQQEAQKGEETRNSNEQAEPEAVSRTEEPRETHEVRQSEAEEVEASEEVVDKMAEKVAEELKESEEPKSEETSSTEEETLNPVVEQVAEAPEGQKISEAAATNQAASSTTQNEKSEPSQDLKSAEEAKTERVQEKAPTVEEMLRESKPSSEKNARDFSFPNMRARAESSQVDNNQQQLQDTPQHIQSLLEKLPESVQQVVKDFLAARSSHDNFLLTEKTAELLRHVSPEKLLQQLQASNILLLPKQDAMIAPVLLRIALESGALGAKDLTSALSAMHGEKSEVALFQTGAAERAGRSEAAFAGSDKANGQQRLTRSQASRTMEKVEQALQEAAKSRDGKTISLRLDPPSLGTLRADVSMRDGILHARLVADSPQVNNMLRERSHELQGMLRRLGLDVDQVSVSVGGDEEQKAGQETQLQHDNANGQNEKENFSAGSVGENGERVKTDAPKTAPADDHWVA